MFSYVNNKVGFLLDFNTGHIASWLEAEIKDIYNKSQVNDAEIASWRTTLPYMAIVLNDDRIPDTSEIVMEYLMEGADPDGKYRRVDVMLAGTGQDGHDNIVMLEFKQYSNIFYVENSPDKQYKIIFFGKTQYHDNPSEQLNTYSELISGYNEAVNSGQISLYKAVCMLNLNTDIPGTSNRQTLDLIEDPSLVDKVFYEGQLNDLQVFLVDKIGGASDDSTITKFAKGEPAASDDFYNLIRQIFTDTAITLRKDQNECFIKLVERIDKRLEDDECETVKRIAVKGGPGSGKSVLALILYKEYLEKGYTVKYLPSGSALKDTVQSAIPDEYRDNILYELNTSADVIILDEMHRCSKSTVQKIFQMEPAPKVVLAFYDERQGYRSDTAKLSDLYCEDEDVFILKSQYRCGGDKGYLSWIDNKLYGEYYPFDRGSIYFDFEVIDTVDELASLVRDPNNVILVGPLEVNDPISFVNGQLEIRVKKYDAYRRGNHLNNVFTLNHWINDSNYYGNNNNIQGIEAENIVVILGDELCVLDGHIECRDTIYSNEGARKNYLGLTRVGEYRTLENGGRDLTPEEKAELCISVKNIYRILLTRGLKSCRIYSADENIRNLFKN